MRALLLAGLLFAGPGCDDAEHSNVHPDFGIAPLPIGTACAPDVPPISACGYWPQHWCDAAGGCQALCDVDVDCPTGSTCYGAGDRTAGECRPADSGGNDGGAT